MSTAWVPVRLICQVPQGLMNSKEQQHYWYLRLPDLLHETSHYSIKRQCQGGDLAFRLPVTSFTPDNQSDILELSPIVYLWFLWSIKQQQISRCEMNKPRFLLSAYARASLFSKTVQTYPLANGWAKIRWKKKSESNLSLTFHAASNSDRSWFAIFLDITETYFPHG